VLVTIVIGIVGSLIGGFIGRGLMHYGRLNDTLIFEAWLPDEFSRLALWDPSSCSHVSTDQRPKMTA